MRAATLIGLSIIFVVLWSSGWVVSRFVIEDVSAIALLTTRYCVLFVVLVAVVCYAKHWRKLTRLEVLCHFGVGALSHAIYLLAGVSAFEMGVSAGLVAFVTSLQPMVTACLSAPITKEQISARQWKGLLIGFLAVLLLVSESYRHGVSALALGLPFLSALVLSLGALVNRRIELERKYYKRRPTPITLILLIQSIGALGILIPLSVSTGQLQFEYTTNQWMVLLWLAIVVSLGAYAVMLMLLRHLSAMRVSSLTYLVPPATMIQAYVLFNETITVTDLAGLAVAALGVYLVVIPKYDISIIASKLISHLKRRFQSVSLSSARMSQSNSLQTPTTSNGRNPDIEL